MRLCNLASTLCYNKPPFVLAWSCSRRALFTFLIDLLRCVSSSHPTIIMAPTTLSQHRTGLSECIPTSLVFETFAHTLDKPELQNVRTEMLKTMSTEWLVEQLCHMWRDELSESSRTQVLNYLLDEVHQTIGVHELHKSGKPQHVNIDSALSERSQLLRSTSPTPKLGSTCFPSRASMDFTNH
jgi:hypothetical protein